MSVEATEKSEKLEVDEEKAAESKENPAETAEQIAEAAAERERKFAAKTEEDIKTLELQITEYIKIFDDPAASFDEKMRTLVRIPTEIQFQHSLLNRDRSDRLFASIPIEMYQRIFAKEHEEYAYARPVLIHILGFLVQCTSPHVHRKFKPLMPAVVNAVNPRGNKVPMSNSIYNDATTIVCMWSDEKGDGICIYELLRHITSYFNAQKVNLEVGQFLLSVRLLIQKIFQVAPLENPNSFDNRVWTIGILSIVRRLLQEKIEKFSKELRRLLWDVISLMTRVGGIAWFNLDKTFSKLAIQMNHIEMQLTLYDTDNLDVAQFCQHLRVLELYTTAICESEMFGEDEMEIVPTTVGDSTRFILTFWVETYLQKIPLPTQLSLSIFHFAVYLFCHGELSLNEENVRKHFGCVMLDTATTVLREACEQDLRGEVGTLFTDLLERLHEFEILDEQVPVFIIKYLEKIRIAVDYEGWKSRVIDVRCCIMDLRGRVDWYSKKSIDEAKLLLPKFTDPEKHEISHLMSVFDQLPRVN